MLSMKKSIALAALSGFLLAGCNRYSSLNEAGAACESWAGTKGKFAYEYKGTRPNFDFMDDLGPSYEEYKDTAYLEKRYCSHERETKQFLGHEYTKAIVGKTYLENDSTYGKSVVVAHFKY
jgi:hypothetical protein